MPSNSRPSPSIGVGVARAESPSLGRILRSYCATKEPKRPSKPAVFLAFHARVILRVLQANTIIAALEDPRPVQRDKLVALRPLVATIRAYDDGDYARVVRAIKKRLNSPKLAAEIGALIAELDRD